MSEGEKPKMQRKEKAEVHQSAVRVPSEGDSTHGRTERAATAKPIPGLDSQLSMGLHSSLTSIPDNKSSLVASPV